MEHMSRESISMERRLEMIRESCGAVSSDNGFITVCSYSWMLTVNVSSAIAVMGVNDFKKMLRVVRKQLDPDYYYDYLGIWHSEIDKRISKYSKAIQAAESPYDAERYHRMNARYNKLLEAVKREMDKLPGYVFEE